MSPVLFWNRRWCKILYEEFMTLNTKTCCIWCHLSFLILKGNWAESHLHSLSASELQQYSDLLDTENPDLFKYLTRQENPPKELQDNVMYKVRVRISWTWHPTAPLFVSRYKLTCFLFHNREWLLMSRNFLMTNPIRRLALRKEPNGCGDGVI